VRAGGREATRGRSRLGKRGRILDDRVRDEEDPGKKGEKKRFKQNAIFLEGSCDCTALSGDAERPRKRMAADRKQRSTEECRRLDRHRQKARDGDSNQKQLQDGKGAGDWGPLENPGSQVCGFEERGTTQREGKRRITYPVSRREKETKEIT